MFPDYLSTVQSVAGASGIFFNYWVDKLEQETFCF